MVDNSSLILAAQRLKAIARELSNKSGSKAARIDIAVLRLEVLIEDLDAGVEA